ncbi:hypothetical protein U4960_12225 [Altererythrobacter sp. H2]|uniref:hypothetical protein n=1 Tax=Altererythrobacter sp. H2 TaxID=3108391 RepID=UPI002B4BABB9|nr:hypothetical protein [Altererythrobacter sp. H2]WRK95054.1 hypothetical protein U4960_12225 [Altererythrobacter sp. H2]
MRSLAVFCALALSACATVPAKTDSLDAIASDYVLLQLTIGEKEAGYIDAYYGDPAVQDKAKTEAPGQSLPMLEARTAALKLRAEQFADDGVEGLGMDERRARFLAAQMTAARTRIRMMRGEQFSFVEEAQGLFGVTPETPPLESFDPALAEIDALVPGEGPLWQRLDRFNRQFDIPADRLSDVFDAAIAECKRRTLEHLTLPAGESFDLGYVTDKPWSGYNYYKGQYHSRIEINTDLPTRLNRAVDLGCHEGYPGHHVFNALLERDLVNGKGWVEFAVYPLYSPQSLIAEGSANYGIDLAFPGNEQLEFETRVLAPLAGLQGADLATYRKLNAATRALGPARYTISAQYLAGEIDAEKAKALLQQYQLLSPERAAQSLRFTDTYRSYIINYGLGRDMVQASIERSGPGQAERWARMIRLLSEPTLPGDL